MAFFSLTTQQEPQQRDQIAESLLLYRNNDHNNSLSKGFELWQQQQQQTQQFQEYNFYTQARGFTVGPDQELALRGPDGGPSGSGLEMMIRGGGLGGMEGGGVISCQDCGNQAKKDCLHMRCRTCCKSRGFNCQTHIKSTWVPAAVRREKQQQQQQSSEVQSQREYPRRQKEKRTSSSSAGLQVGDFPAEFNGLATFQCVRVRSIKDAHEEYAYQTAVNIGGHVFRGILYDQGPNKNYNNLTVAGETSAGINDQRDDSLATTLFDTSNYPSPLGTFISGMPFFYNP